MTRPGDPRYHAVLEKMGALHDAKQQGYGTERDSFANYHAVAALGIAPSAYVIGRMREKMTRIEAGVRGDESVDVEEELLDVGVLSAIAAVLRTEEL